MSIIRNQEALEQPLDFSSLSRFSNGVTDLDACVNLKNVYLIDIEVKKDTFSHTFENIRFSRQWRILETKAGTNPTNILIYAVHDMLVLVADETKEKEPYATITICDLEKAAYMVFDLVSEME